MKLWTFYILICPIDKEVRYVGITSGSLSKRLVAHLHETDNVEKASWIAWLRDHSLIPLIKRIDDYHGTQKDAEWKERLYVYFYRVNGCHLFNKNHNPGDSAIEFLKRQDTNVARMLSHLSPLAEVYTKQRYSERTGD